LIGVDVRAEIMGGYARATVRQRYRNDESRPIEAIYTFPLPSKGSVTGFAMTSSGRQLAGEVHEREEVEVLAERDDGFADQLSASPDTWSGELADLGASKGGKGDPLLTTLGCQSSSGLWEAQGRDPIEVTVAALLVLLRLGVSTSHPVHSAQTKKAVDALLDALGRAASLDPKLAELALAALWLLSTGRRTRTAIKDATAARPGLEGLAAILGRDDDVRAYVERVAPMC